MQLKYRTNFKKSPKKVIGSKLTSPWLAPFTRPAISTNSIDAGTDRWDLLRLESTWRRGSGTATIPTFGSIVQNGKLAACAFPFSTYKKSIMKRLFLLRTKHSKIRLTF